MEDKIICRLISPSGFSIDYKGVPVYEKINGVYGYLIPVFEKVYFFHTDLTNDSESTQYEELEWKVEMF